jgi:hypothetical protein
VRRLAALPALLLCCAPAWAQTVGSISTRSAIDATDPQYAGGMKCNSTTGNDGTDDTAALQAAIVAADANHTARALVLPGGGASHKCKITGVVIHAPVVIRGAGQKNTIIALASGSTSPAFSAQITAADWTDTSAMADVYIADLQVMSSARADVPGQGVAHGFALNGSLSPTLSTQRVILQHVQINSVPGDCVHHDLSGGGSGRMLVRAYDTECSYPGGDGLNCNSGTDFKWIGGPIYGAGGDNILLSGCINVRFMFTDLFVAAGNDINLFGSDFSCVSCFIDETGTNGVFVNNAGGQPVDFSMTRFRWPSTAANNTWSNIRYSATNTGSVYCASCRFDDPASIPTGGTTRALNNINFVAGNTGKFYADAVTRFDAGDESIVAVSNSATSIFNGTGSASMPGSVTVRSAKQFDGFYINNGTNAVAKMFGSSATNDTGALQLLNATNQNAAFTSNGQSQLSLPLADQSELVVASGASSTVGSNQSRVVLDGVNATFALTMPPAPIDGQPVQLQCGTAVTTLTVSPNAGQSMKGTSTTCGTTQGHAWHYRTANTSWYMDY